MLKVFSWSPEMLYFLCRLCPYGAYVSCIERGKRQNTMHIRSTLGNPLLEIDWLVRITNATVAHVKPSILIFCIPGIPCYYSRYQGILYVAHLIRTYNVWMHTEVPDNGCTTLLVHTSDIIPNNLFPRRQLRAEKGWKLGGHAEHVLRSGRDLSMFTYMFIVGLVG